MSVAGSVSTHVGQGFDKISDGTVLTTIISGRFQGKFFLGFSSQVFPLHKICTVNTTQTPVGCSGHGSSIMSRWNKSDACLSCTL